VAAPAPGADRRHLRTEDSRGGAPVAQPDFAAGLAGVPDELVEALCAPLVDHHVHTSFAGPVSRAEFEQCLNEGSPDPVPPFMTQFDSQLGFAVRRWCGPLLGLEPHAPADRYWARRAELGEEAVARALLPAAGVRRWIVDPGYAGDRVTPTSTLAAWSGAPCQEVIRLESLGEELVASGVAAGEYAAAFRARLADRGPDVVGAKSIVAYRCGFDVDWTRPTDADVAAEVAGWTDRARMTSPVLCVFGIHAAAQAGLPVQFHVGLGDRDLDLHRVDPMLMLGLLRQPSIQQVPVLLLHCYPFHRQAGYLAQAFPNVCFDVGLGVNYAGVRSVEIIAEALEMAPFAAQLYSSDAWGPPELHLLGSLLWRRGMARVLARWVREGDWAVADSVRVVHMIGTANAERVYRLTT
jgi:predicted TIM-barrel fold metal-dependent hydrolase